MTDTLPATIPDHLQRHVAQLITNLQAMTEDELEQLAIIQQDRILELMRVNRDDPVARFEYACHDLRTMETNYRLESIQRMEAQLAGGHLVSVGCGNEISKYSAVCDPNPPGKFCWEGPDRDTIEEALADGRAHHPGQEPTVYE